MKAKELFSISEKFPFRSFFEDDQAPWMWVTQIREALAGADFVSNDPQSRPLPSGVFIEGSVYLDPTVVLSPHVVIKGPAYIGAYTQIRPGAYIRGNVIIGENCVVGNSCELKNCLLLNKVQVPHFNYVGDSILGNRSHLGAGVICSNLRLDQAPVPIKLPTGIVSSGLVKLGALVGDEAEVGCNTVLNPGTILGKRSLVYPSMAFGGVLEADTMVGPRASEYRFVKRR